MRIALDVMGGDFAPQEIVRGGLLAAAKFTETEIILVGKEEAVREVCATLPENVSICPASEVIGMDEHPAQAVKQKKDSSLVRATALVAKGEADALVSAGSTGAQMAAALFGLGRIKGISRPGIGSVLPGTRRGRFMVDIGANVDATPEQLLQYGIMGSIFSEEVLGFANPSVALLNIGSEEGKGNELSRAAYELLKNSGLNFVGNIEGRDLFAEGPDVVVCEAFTGNVAIKTTEGVADMMFSFLKEKLAGNEDVYPVLQELRTLTDSTEFGGAPLLGVAGISIVCHGNSDAKAICNAVRVARECVTKEIVARIKLRVES
jgi:glycerol-3-phosphate acyltransferase PlsX